MTISFRKKTKAEWLVVFVVFFPFAFFFGIDLLGLPSLIKYTIDIAWIILLASMLYTFRSMPNKEGQQLLKLVLLFVAFTAVGVIGNFQSIFYYLWGIRNNMRFYVFFFACIFFLREQSIKHYLRFFGIVFWINFVVTLFQYVFLGLKQDYLGGIFGVEKGCNAYTNIFLVIVCANSILNYINHKEKLFSCFAICGASLFVAVLSELKIFIVEIVIILILSVVLSEFSARKIWIAVGISFGTVVAVQMIALLMPHFADWFSLENIIEAASDEYGYTMRNDMNRLTSFTISWNSFLNNGFEKIFGLGLGNCDYSSSFDFLASPFYNANRLMHYTWFSSSFLLLETGLSGIVLFVLFFVGVYYYAAKRRKNKKADPVYCQLAQILAVICCIMVVYNSALRTEAAYMAYFVMALPFVNKESREKSKSTAFLFRKQTQNEIKVNE